jgi:hypothetical protein
MTGNVIGQWIFHCVFKVSLINKYLCWCGVLCTALRGKHCMEHEVEWVSGEQKLFFDCAINSAQQ